MGWGVKISCSLFVKIIIYSSELSEREREREVEMEMMLGCGGFEKFVN
jgi:hypothetical protein